MSYQNQQPQYNQPQQREKPQQIMNAVITTGAYTTREGKQKKSYLTIGKLFIYAGGGMSLKLDAYPTSNQIITFYPIKPKEEKQFNQQPQQNQHNNNNNYGGNGQQYQGQNNNNYSQNQGH